MKISRFTNILKRKDVYLVHNALVNSILKVYLRKYQKFIDSIENAKNFQFDETDEFQRTMKDLNIIVDDFEDEMADLNSRFFVFEHSSELYVLLIVTRKCNFRCSYCYEDYIDQDMSQEVFSNSRKFIISEIKNNRYKAVWVSFFGGEPTLMADQINQFMESLIEENRKLPYPANIKAMMTTNGYLLNSHMLDRFIKNRIVRYQITVDGLEEDHNCSRYLANGKGTWKTIVNNLKYFNNIINSEVSVLLRSNITPQLYEHMDEWLEFLHKNFMKGPFFIHFEVAKNYGHMNDENFKLLENEKEVIIDIIDRAKKWRLPLELIAFATMPFSLVCYAARQFSVIIDYNGEVKKCTSSSLDEPYNCIGKITEKGEMICDWKKAAQWTSYEVSENCKKCSILPLCYQRKCPAAKKSFEMCDFLCESYRKGLEYFYL